MLVGVDACASALMLVGVDACASALMLVGVEYIYIIVHLFVTDKLICRSNSNSILRFYVTNNNNIIFNYITTYLHKTT